MVRVKLSQYYGIANHIPFANEKQSLKTFKTNTVIILIGYKVKRRRGTGSEYCYELNLHKWCQQQYGPIAKFAHDNGRAEILHFEKNDGSRDIIYVDHDYDPE